MYYFLNVNAIFKSHLLVKSFKMKNIFIHHVFFWLKNSGSEEAIQQLADGLTKLSAVQTIKKFHIGQPAATSRSVVENTYDVSWCVEFDNDADQEAYQVDPVHLQFVTECSHLWSRVVVYDSVSI